MDVGPGDLIRWLRMGDDGDEYHRRAEKGEYLVIAVSIYIRPQNGML